MPPPAITIVVAPVELTVIYTDTARCLKHLEDLADSFGIPLSALFSSGCVKLFKGAELPVRVRDASVDAGL